MPHNPLPCFGLLLCLAVPASALEVQARLDNDSIRHGETVALILESDIQPEAGPDLGPLSRDFRIVGRSSSRQIHEINGQREEHHELRLILSPLRSGHLEIPAIAFGKALTRPLRLDVGNGKDSGTTEPVPPPRPSAVLGDAPPSRVTLSKQGGPTPAAPTPPSVPSPKPAPPKVARPATSRSWFLAGWPGMLISLVLLGSLGLVWRRVRGWTACKGEDGLPAGPSASGSVDVGGLTSVFPPASPRRRCPREDLDTGRCGRLGSSLPPWGSQTRNLAPQPRGLANPVVPPSAVDTSRPQNEIQGRAPRLAEAIVRVRRAYAGGDASVARDALLNWAALVLSDRPPRNLALLAGRCREPLRSEILLLDQAFFSPDPLAWDRLPVWERLPDFAPLPPGEPASFRQKKPLWRRPQIPA